MINILKIIYFASFNITAIGLICALWSVNIKLKSKYTEMQIELMNDYKNRHGLDNDIADKIMKYITLFVFAICPVINSIIAVEMILEWSEFRDDVYMKSEREEKDIWYKTKEELKQDKPLNED